MSHKAFNIILLKVSRAINLPLTIHMYYLLENLIDLAKNYLEN